MGMCSSFDCNLGVFSSLSVLGSLFGKLGVL